MMMLGGITKAQPMALAYSVLHEKLIGPICSVSVVSSSVLS